MSIFHCSVKNISRSGGKSAVASAAYRAGEKLVDDETGLTHNYTGKKEVAFSEIILCDHAPEEYKDRSTLWNEVEKIEKQSNARLAREWEVAIPNELDFEQSKKLVHDFAQSLADEGMCVDVSIHWKDGNHHAHILGTTRPIKENGQWGQKEKKDYAKDENGQRIPIIDPKTGQQKVRVRKGKGEEKLWQRVTVEANDWNKTEKVEEWRKRWANECNKYLSQEKKIDHRSFERQGIEQIPTIHEGYVARQMESRGEVAERCEINRDIKATNAKLAAVQQLLTTLKKERDHLLERLKELFKAPEKPTMSRSEAGKYKSNINYLERAHERLLELNKQIKANNAECKEVEEWYNSKVFHLHGREDKEKLDNAIQARDYKNLDLKCERNKIYDQINSLYDTDVSKAKEVKKLMETLQEHLDRHDIIPDRPAEPEKKKPELALHPERVPEKEMTIVEELANNKTPLDAFRKPQNARKSILGQLDAQKPGKDKKTLKTPNKSVKKDKGYDR